MRTMCVLTNPRTSPCFLWSGAQLSILVGLSYNAMKKMPSSNGILDQTEEEAYWAEVEENAILGAAGFREPGEHYVHWQSD